MPVVYDPVNDEQELEDLRKRALAEEQGGSNLSLKAEELAEIEAEDEEDPLPAETKTQGSIFGHAAPQEPVFDDEYASERGDEPNNDSASKAGRKIADEIRNRKKAESESAGGDAPDFERKAAKEGVKGAEKELARGTEKSAAREIGENTAQNSAQGAVEKAGKGVLKRLGLVSEEAAPATEGVAGAEGAEGVAIGAAEGGTFSFLRKAGIVGALFGAGWTAWQVRNEVKAGNYREASGEAGDWIGGAAAGLGAGLLIGSWTGPGALVTGAVGLVVGAGVGAIGAYVGKKAAQSTYDLVEGTQPQHRQNAARNDGLSLPRGPSPNGHNYDALQGPSTTHVIGDSIAFGLAPHFGGKLHNLAVEGSGITGVNGALNQLKQVDAQAGDRLFVHTGRNNVRQIKTPQGLADYTKEFTSFAVELQAMQKQKHVDIVALLPLPNGDADAFGVRDMGNLQRKILTDHGIRFVESNEHFTRDAAQQIHPNYSTVISAIKNDLGQGWIKPTPAELATQLAHNQAHNKNSTSLAAPAPLSKLEVDAVAFFVHKGWTLTQAAGIVANLVSESGLQAHGAAGDGGSAIGVAQWHPDRQAKFKTWTGISLEQASLQQHLEFVNYELTHDALTDKNGNVVHDSKGRTIPLEKAAGDMLRMATTAAQAGEIVSRSYERPGLTEEAKNAAAVTRGLRAENIHALSVNDPNVQLASRTPLRRAPGSRNNLLPQELADASPMHPVPHGAGPGPAEGPHLPS